MTVVVDLNVILDVVQRREPHYTDSALLLSKIVEGSADGRIPGHAITTVYYLVRRYVNRTRAEETVDWLLNHLEVISASENEFRAARQLPIHDFEDAVVAAMAEHASCDVIATRNLEDFELSPIPAKSPKEILEEEDWAQPR